MSVSLTLLLGVAVIFFLMLSLNTAPHGENPIPGTVTPVETEQQEQTSPVQTETVTDEPDTSETETDISDETSQSVPPENYDYTKPVPESAPVDISYYDDALFIGDSRTEGFRMFAGLNNATYYSAKGLMASTAFTEPFVSPDGMNIPDGTVTGEDGRLTVAQALEYSGYFGKIYIMLGINELGWTNTDAFIEHYSSLVELAREYHPDACIYVQLIIPVSKSKSDADTVYNNERIGMFNGLIAQMCADEHVYCINTPEAVEDSDGALPEDAGVDGVHMKSYYCELWRDYLFDHTVCARHL